MAYKEDWKTYQSRLKKQAEDHGKKNYGNVFVKLIILSIIFWGLYIFFDGIGFTAGGCQEDIKAFIKNLIDKKQKINKKKKEKKEEVIKNKEIHLWKKSDVQDVLKNQQLLNSVTDTLSLDLNNKKYYVMTSLDTHLQSYMLKKIYKKTTQYMGFVAIEPETGKILSMIGFSKKRNVNPCTEIKYPAASVFKIITAAAAIEICGLDEDSELTYNGRKHTLYKSQLKEKITK